MSQFLMEIKMIILWMSEFIDIPIKCKNDLSVSFILPKFNCSNLKWHSVVCLAPKCLYVCLTMYALDELMAGVLGDLLLDLEQGITQLLGSLRWYLAALG